MEWTEKYRPHKLNEVIGQEKIMRVIRGYLKLGVEDMPHLIFQGDYGTGKTTTARCIAKELKAHLIEVNASQEGGIDRIREMSRRFNLASSMHDWTVDKDGNRVTYGTIMLIDEAERLSEPSQRAMRITLEKPQTHTKVIMCVNELTTTKNGSMTYKLDEGLLKRLDLLKFRNLSEEDMRKIAEKVIIAEGVEIGNEELTSLIQGVGGRPRDLIRKLYHYHVSTIEA